MKERLRIRLINRLKVRTTFTSSSAPSLSKENQQAQEDNADRLFRYGMDEFGTAGMQADAAVRIRTGKTVFQVAFDWASHLGKLATDLVRRPVFRSIANR